jgi:hypothetical protein
VLFCCNFISKIHAISCRYRGGVPESQAKLLAGSGREYRLVAAAMGDQAWRQSLDSHDHLAKQMVEKHRGNLAKSTGDGILATFDGPGRAVRCALALGTAAQQIGLPLRADLHTGEIEIRGKDIGGIHLPATSRLRLNRFRRGRPRCPALKTASAPRTMVDGSSGRHFLARGVPRWR